LIPLRDENPSRTTPYITRILIAANVVIYLLAWTSGSTQIAAKYGMTPILVLQGKQLYTVFTSMFIHGGITHLAGNMLYLYIFGDNVEDNFGHIHFLFFYILCGLVADATHIFTTTDLMIPTIGASGAISGVLGAYLALYPRAKISSLVFAGWIFVTKIPAILFLGFWFILQLFSGTLTLASEVSSGVAYWAHIGGFVAGLILVPIFKRHRQT
jgi:membrane associated rhomboid family serine protease